MTEVLFIHSAGLQGPGEGSHRLLTALRAQLPERFVLHAPLMPDPDRPEPEAWIAAVQSAIERIDGDLVLAGHSLGGSTALQVLDRFGIPARLLGVVTLAAPFWGAADWPYPEYGLSADAAERLRAIGRVIIMRGDLDDVVAADHPGHYKAVMPQAERRTLPGIDHEAATAAPHLVQAILDITDRQKASAN